MHFSKFNLLFKKIYREIQLQYLLATHIL